MLLRRVVHYTFKYIGEHDWDLGIIDDYSELLKNGPLKYVSVIRYTTIYGQMSYSFAFQQPYQQQDT